MNPLDEEIFSLCQTLNLAMLNNYNDSAASCIQYKLKALCNELSPKAQGRINRELDRRSPTHLKQSISILLERMRDILCIHAISIDLPPDERLEALINKLAISKITIQKGGHECAFRGNTVKPSHIGHLWFPQDSIQSMMEKRDGNFEVQLITQHPQIYHWCLETHFAYGFNVIHADKFARCQRLSFKFNTDIKSHTKSDLLGVGNRILAQRHND